MNEFTSPAQWTSIDRVTMLKQAVERRLERHLQPDARIEVALRGEIPVIRGRVYSSRSYADAEQCLREISGSDHIVNQLNIKAPEPDQRREDRQLARAIHDRFFYTPCGDFEHLDVHIAANIVTLRGIVRTAHQRILAASAAASVNGIRSIRNQLVVLGSEIARDERIAQHLVDAFHRAPLHGLDLPLIEVADSRVLVRRQGIENKLLNQIAKAASAAPGIKGIRVTP